MHTAGTYFKGVIDERNFYSFYICMITVNTPNYLLLIIFYRMLKMLSQNIQFFPVHFVSKKTFI